VVAGSPAQFTVGASGSFPLYQWFKNGLPIPNANAATYSLANAQTADAGTYSVLVSNLVSSMTSTAVTLTVNAPSTPPRITSFTAVPGGLVTIQWASVAGKTYRVDFKNNLGSPTWTQLGGNVPATGPTTQVTDNMGANIQRFYRVSLLD
jgi:hypothetical protein